MNRTAENKSTNRYTFHKVCTSIPGLDDIFYGGIDLSPLNINIMICGGDELRRTTFSLQLMYGISQHLKRIHNARCSEYHTPFIVPEYFSTRENSIYLEDLLLDMVISCSIRQITKYAVTDYDGKSLCIKFSDTFFNSESICAAYDDSIYDMHICHRLFLKTRMCTSVKGQYIIAIAQIRFISRHRMERQTVTIFSSR